MVDNQTDTNPRPDVRKLGHLIKGIKYAMLTTQDAQGHLRSRPMATEEIGVDGDLWFFTDDETPKVEEIRRNQEVNISYADPESDRFVSVSGPAEIVRDRSKMESLWSPVYRAWFPQGLDDPHLVLLRIRAEQAQYWDVSEHRMKHVLAMAKTALTGRRSQSSENLTHKVDLRR